MIDAVAKTPVEKAVEEAEVATGKNTTRLEQLIRKGHERDVRRSEGKYTLLERLHLRRERYR